MKVNRLDVCIKLLNDDNGVGTEVLHNLLVQLESQWHPELKNKSDAMFEYAEKIYTKAVVLGAYSIEGETLGVAAFYGNDQATKQGYLTYIALFEQYTRQGIGQYLLNAVEEKAIAMGMTSMKLEVKKTNSRALNLYANKGYVKVADATEHSIYMCRKVV